MEAKESLIDFWQAIAPNILGNKFIKQLLTLQAFTNPYNNEFLNFLIIGDTGCGKTALLQDCVAFTPRSVFLNRNTSPAGVTERIIESDGGLVCLDEFDKVNAEVRRSVLEPMESHIITKDVHNQHYSITTRVNVTVLCNPRGRLEAGVPILSQITFGKDLPLLGRFDLIIPIYPADEVLYPDIAVGYAKYDEKLNNKRIEMIKETIVSRRTQIPQVFVSEDFARRAGAFIRLLRGTSSKREIITPRAIRGFINSMKSNARLNGRSKVNMQDFKYVKSIYSKLMR